MGVPAKSNSRRRGDGSLWGVRWEGRKGGERTAFSGEQEARWEPGEHPQGAPTKEPKQPWLLL